MRLIDADEIPYTMLYKENFLKGTGVEAQAAWKSDIDSIPTMDAVPIVRCKNCKNRGIVNVCPHAGYMTVGKKVNRGTDTSPYPYNYGTEIVTYCNAKDNGYCDMAERREE